MKSFISFRYVMLTVGGYQLRVLSSKSLNIPYSDSLQIVVKYNVFALSECEPLQLNTNNAHATFELSRNQVFKTCIWFINQQLWRTTLSVKKLLQRFAIWQIILDKIKNIYISSSSAEREIVVRKYRSWNDARKREGLRTADIVSVQIFICYFHYYTIQINIKY